MIKLREVSAQGFRTLEDFTVQFEDDYCTISGQNNAGKTSIITIIRHFLDEFDRPWYLQRENKLSFRKDRTQWAELDQMEISIHLELHRENDSEVFYVVDHFSTEKIDGDTAFVRLTEKFDASSNKVIECHVNDRQLAEQNASEVAKKIKSSANLVVHNSTAPNYNIFSLSGQMTEVLESHFTEQDRKKINDAERQLSNRVKKAAKSHKQELGQLLGRLDENYDVELTTLVQGGESRFPLNIKLNDKSVVTNLAEWGSGTQNRTRVLISILEAEQIRKTTNVKNRSTPVVIIEEPESFLHPSAQAAFGKVLNELAKDFGIQILTTTHSPYMLNRNTPSANILLERKEVRGKLKQSCLVNTSGTDWMLPFASNLGVLGDDFIPWEKIIQNGKRKVIPVEGLIDVEYFEIVRNRFSTVCKLQNDVEVLDYGGKDSLKNTQVLKLMISMLDGVFITYDLDAKEVAEKRLEAIGLRQGKDYFAIGINKPGKESIEGLLPERITAAVHEENGNLISALTSSDNQQRNQAKRELKSAYLSKFKAAQLTSDDVAPFVEIINKIANAFN